MSTMAMTIPALERLEGVVRGNFDVTFMCFSDDASTVPYNIDTSLFLVVFGVAGLLEKDNTGDDLVVSAGDPDASPDILNRIDVHYDSAETAGLFEGSFRFWLKLVDLADDTDKNFLTIGSVDFVETGSP